MAKFRSKWIDLSDEFLFSGNVQVPTPTDSNQAVNKQYVDDIIADLHDSKFESKELEYTDTTNKVIDLAATIDITAMQNWDDVVVIPIGGSVLDYGVDYTIRAKGATIYIVLSQTSTAPGGGSFDGGDTSNPSTGVDGTLLSGDLVKVMYPTLGGGGSSGGGSAIQASQMNWFYL